MDAGTISPVLFAQVFPIERERERERRKKERKSLTKRVTKRTSVPTRGVQSYRAGAEGHVKLSIWRCVMAVLSGMCGACIVCVRVCVVPPYKWVSCAGVASEFARMRLTSPTCAWTRLWR